MTPKLKDDEIAYGIKAVQDNRTAKLVFNGKARKLIPIESIRLTSFQQRLDDAWREYDNMSDGEKLYENYYPAWIEEQ